MDLAMRFFAQSPFFQDLDEHNRQRLAQQAVPVSLQPGEILGLDGDPCEAIYFLVEGRVRVIKTSAQGREQVVEELAAGEPFYVVPALDQLPLPATTQAATRATVLRLARSDLMTLIQEHPAISMHLLRHLARRLRTLTALVESLSLFSVPQRLARLLLENTVASDGHRMTQREMAAQLGTVREVIARTLGQFAEHGWLRLGRGSIEILDAQALRQLAATGDI